MTTNCGMVVVKGCMMSCSDMFCYGCIVSPQANLRVSNLNWNWESEVDSV